MQLLAGRYKGARIKTSTKMPYRPTLSRIRKSLFDILFPFNYQNVLDLFSGTGILGFEAASRGANKITFVERDRKSIQLLESNANQFPDIDFVFNQQNVYTFLNNPKSYDLIFADPPYTSSNIHELVETVLKILNKNGKFVLETNKRSQPMMNAIVKNYGNTVLSIWTKE
ncbi:uncharacterized protein METZ01_LOCUS164965 [marine metagenome]|uniref:Methyltransferase small domain-containing protein n=1 Tax=marine metagenome TaxID=408172 RepID=A0A382BF41_9ZZZZ